MIPAATECDKVLLVQAELGGDLRRGSGATTELMLARALIGESLDHRLPDLPPEWQPRDEGIQGQAVRAPGEVLHDLAGGAVSRLRVEGDHLGAGAGAAAGRMLAADPERLGARLRPPAFRDTKIAAAAQ